MMVNGLFIEECCGNCAKSEGAPDGGRSVFCTLEAREPDCEEGRDSSPCRHYGDFEPSFEAVAELAHQHDLRSGAGVDYPASMGRSTMSCHGL